MTLILEVLMKITLVFVEIFIILFINIPILYYYKYYAIARAIFHSILLEPCNFLY